VLKKAPIANPIDINRIDLGEKGRLLLLVTFGGPILSLLVKPISKLYSLLYIEFL
jgi:hypothetical protein